MAEPGFNACPALCSGSPADVCELLAGDEIVSINGAEVGHHYKESVMHVITQAITSGVLDLRIRRYISSGTSSSHNRTETRLLVTLCYVTM